MIKLSDYVVKFIEGLGVRHVFMLPGGGAMHLNDSLGRSKKLYYICSLHEQAAAIAADAYSQYTNNIGVAMVTTGPGGTNALTGVAASWLDSIPVIIISGQVKRADIVGTRKVRQMGFQEIDIVSLARPITKYAVTITKPEEIRWHLEKAVYHARKGRPGPVWIDIPLDVQASMLDEKKLRGFVPERKKAEDALLKRKIARAVGLLNRAKRPVILAGNGIRLAGALKAFRDLLAILKVPVLTTWKAADYLPETHPLYIGRPGAVGQRGANFAQQNADLLISIGARLDFGQTAYNHGLFARGARKIIVDIDAAEIAKLDMNIDVPIQADAGLVIREMIGQCRNGFGKEKFTLWLSQCKAWQEKYPVVLPEYWKEKKHVNDYVLLEVLSDELGKGDLLVPGSSGACSERTMQAFRVREGVRIFNSQGLGSMGFGIPAAIGGCIASGMKRTVCIEGDGGFVMNMQELEVVKRLELPIKFFVLNNGGYVSIQTTQRSYFKGKYVASNKESGLTLPDFVRVAKGFGIPAFRIGNHEGIRGKIRKVLEIPGPVLCDIMVSPEQVTTPRVMSKKRKDGSMVSLPMEDLWPFLDREEFMQNMIVEPVKASLV